MTPSSSGIVSYSHPMPLLLDWSPARSGNMSEHRKRPTGTHNPSASSLRRWDNEGGAPAGGRTKRPLDSSRSGHTRTPDRQFAGSAHLHRACARERNVAFPVAARRSGWPAARSDDTVAELSTPPAGAARGLQFSLSDIPQHLLFQ